MKLWRGLPAVLWVLVAVGAGCSSPTSPNPSAAATLQGAERGSSTAPAGATNPPTIRPEGQTLVVLGLMDTPDPCQSITADVAVSGSAVTVRVSARGVGQVCVAAIGRFAYRVSKVVARGTYDVTVMHEYPGSGWETIVAGSATIAVQ